MGDYLREQYGEPPRLTYKNNGIKMKKAFRFLAALFILFVVCAWTLKGLEYLTEKTRQVRLDADYTEVMLRAYRD